MISPKDYLYIGLFLSTISTVMLASFLRLGGIIWLITIAILIFTVYRVLHALKINGGRMQGKDWLIAVAPGIILFGLVGIFAVWGL